MEKPKQVFISHSHGDQDWVQAFARQLNIEGIKAWVATNEVAIGEPWADKLEAALRLSDAFVFIVDAESVSSPNASFELGVALGGGKRIIAVVDKDVLYSDLPGPIRKRRYLSKEQPEETARDVAKALLAA